MIFEDVNNPPLLGERREGDWDLANGLEAESRPPNPVSPLVRPFPRRRSLKSIEHPFRLYMFSKAYTDTVGLDDGRAKAFRREACPRENLAERCNK